VIHAAAAAAAAGHTHPINPESKLFLTLARCFFDAVLDVIGNDCVEVRKGAIWSTLKPTKRVGKNMFSNLFLLLGFILGCITLYFNISLLREDHEDQMLTRKQRVVFTVLTFLLAVLLLLGVLLYLGII
jgi:hypothetical protein